MSHLLEQLDRIDIYLLDQLLRGRIRPGMRILDAGAGSGRNVLFLMLEGYDVVVVDENADAVARLRARARTIAPALPDANFRVERLETMGVPPQSADVVISSAVLHFARDDVHFDEMLEGSWRALASGGLFFCRLASSIGIEALVKPLGGRRFRLPDGSDRYLVDEAFLMEKSETLCGQLLDPIKTTVVQGLRSMTTWVLQKR